jgi:hypothetical protein
MTARAGYVAPQPPADATSGRAGSLQSLRSDRSAERGLLSAPEGNISGMLGRTPRRIDQRVAYRYLVINATAQIRPFQARNPTRKNSCWRITVNCLCRVAICIHIALIANNLLPRGAHADHGLPVTPVRKQAERIVVCESPESLRDEETSAQPLR